MERTGSQFRYRLGGGASSVTRFRATGGEGRAAGEIVHLASVTVRRTSSGGDALNGAVRAAASVLEVVMDADAVYAGVAPSAR